MYIWTELPQIDTYVTYNKDLSKIKYLITRLEGYNRQGVFIIRLALDGIVIGNFPLIDFKPFEEKQEANKPLTIKEFKNAR